VTVRKIEVEGEVHEFDKGATPEEAAELFAKEADALWPYEWAEGDYDWPMELKVDGERFNVWADIKPVPREYIKEEARIEGATYEAMFMRVTRPTDGEDDDDGT
jgi:hypothetical protein